MEDIKVRLRLQFIKFILVGLLSAGLEFAVFYLLITGVALPYLTANTIAILCAITLNYVLSRIFVFEKSRYSLQAEIASFIFFSLVALLLNQSILWLLVEHTDLHIQICKAIAILLVAAYNFLTKKYIVFRG